MAWGAPTVSSGYKNADGHVTQNWPGMHQAFWAATRELAVADYRFG